MKGLQPPKVLMEIFCITATPDRLTTYKSIKSWTQEYKFSQQVIDYRYLIKLVTSLSSADFNSFLLSLYHFACNV